nr:uncharacterized protein LOC109190477 [Ipomoea batatas]
MQGASRSRNGGQGNTTFKLKLSCDCRIDVGIPPKYVGGSVKWISDLDYDEWGIMTLWEKVEQFGYKRDECRCFAKTDNGLTKLVLDLEKRNRAAQAEIPAVEGEVQMNVLAAEGEVQVNVATAEEDNVQDFVATAADNDVQVNVAAIECLVEVNVVVADDGDVLVEVAAHYGDVPVNVVALYAPARGSPEEISLADLESLLVEDTQGDNIHSVVEDANSQMTGVVTINSHGVKMRFGQPTKRRKIIPDSTKGK